MPITRTPIVDDDGTGTTGTVLDNAWKQELYNQIDASTGAIAAPVLLGHQVNGIPPSTPAGDVVNYIGTSGLQPFETLVFEIELHFSPASIPVWLSWVQSANIQILQLGTFGNPANQFSMVRVFMRRISSVDGYLYMLAQGGGVTPAQTVWMQAIDGWSKSWAAVIQHGGVPAGGFLNCKWSVTKLAG